MTSGASFVNETRVRVGNLLRAFEDIQVMRSRYQALGGEQGILSTYNWENTGADFTKGDFVAMMDAVQKLDELLGQGYLVDLYRAEP